MLDAAVMKSNEGEVVVQVCRMTGNTTSDPTKVYGKGMSVSRVAEGKIRITFGEHQGPRLLGAYAQLGDSAPSNIAGYTVFVDEDSYSASTRTLDLWVYTAADALGDLPTTAKLNVIALFSRSSV